MAIQYPKLRLYRFPGSCSLLSHMVLRHLGIPFDETVMRYAAGGGFEAADGSMDAAAYKSQVNMSGQVPALAVREAGDDNGFVITQNIAITSYVIELAQQAGNPAAAVLNGEPGSLLSRIRVLQWLSYLASTVHYIGFAPGIRPDGFADDKSVHDNLAYKGRQQLVRAFERFEKELGSDFAVNNALTTVDFYLYVLWRWTKMPMFDGLIPGEYPRFEGLARNVEKLPSVQETLEAEGLQRIFSE
ncbi:hypothetical protein PpBr36_04249 [Pyricularia pennisetigena]|uniref:hypothetical protein n=1 Tax=Pyricularia pennisetigena TaxID=1578925 RepID=UPI0011531FA2|nr:hypothetical protein PpBr36_04249 [Pyricularia pennisetigena]TLS26422.1 hypothetical protein PpBr36_04249 [Pyricularia pennisetigena]